MWDQVQRNIDECWLEVSSASGDGNVIGSSIHRLLDRMEERLGIRFTQDERLRVNKLIIANPKATIRQAQACGLLRHIGRTLENYASRGVEQAALLQDLASTSNRFLRQADCLTMTNPETNSHDQRVASLTQEILDLSERNARLEEQIRSRPADQDVCKLLKMTYDSSRRIASLEKVRDEQAYELFELVEREKRIKELEEKVALQEEVIARLRKSPSSTKNREALGEISTRPYSATLYRGLCCVSLKCRDFVVRTPQAQFVLALALVVMIPFILVLLASVLRDLWGTPHSQYSWWHEIPIIEYWIYSYNAWKSRA